KNKSRRDDRPFWLRFCEAHECLVQLNEMVSDGLHRICWLTLRFHLVTAQSRRKGYRVISILHCGTTTIHIDITHCAGGGDCRHKTGQEDGDKLLEQIQFQGVHGPSSSCLQKQFGAAHRCVMLTGPRPGVASPETL